MSKKVVQYILSVLLLACLAYKTSSPILHIVSQEFEFFERLTSEKECKEVEKLYENEVLFPTKFSFTFTAFSQDLDFNDILNALPFRNFELHYPPPNAIS